MRLKPFVLLFVGLQLSACAATTPPPRFSGLDPAAPRAPESPAVKPPSPLERPLGQPSVAPAGSEAMPTGPEHQTQAPSSEQPVADDIYSCPMHRQVKDTKPGQCPICAVPLVKTPAGLHEEHLR
jgi:hypothetical protein